MIPARTIYVQKTIKTISNILVETGPVEMILAETISIRPKQNQNYFKHTCQGKDRNKGRDNIFQGYNKRMNDKPSWFGHSTRNGKNQNRVVDPGGNSRFNSQQAINSSDEDGLVELYLRSLLTADMGLLQPAPMQMTWHNS